MNKRSSIIGCFLLTMAFTLLFAIGAFADNGTNPKLSSATWEQGYESPAVAGWEYVRGEKEQMPVFRVVLYRGKKGQEKRMASVSTRNTHVDFSSVVVEKGTGVYTFTVGIAGDTAEPLPSEEVVVDGSLISMLKAYLAKVEERKSQEFLEGKYGWVPYPDGTWKYRFNDGTFAKGWFDEGGQRYYLASDGTMLTGWQIISNRWYCFASSGALYRNTTTPDGNTVNESGMCMAGGVPVDGSWQPKNNANNSARVLTLIQDIRINSTETKVESLVVRPMRVTTSGKFSIERYSFSKPYEQWQPGVPVDVTVSIAAYTGYSFADNMKVTFNRGELLSNTGSATERVIVYRYYPRLVLESPTNLSFNGWELSWSPVEKAFGYIVKVSNARGDSPEMSTKECTFDLSEFSLSDATVSVCAVASDSLRNYYYDSFPTVITDFDAIRYKGNVAYVGKRIRYTDEFGNLADGWAEMNGNWYHFTTGLSEEKGWWKDGDGFWYYFDDYSRMVTGEITENGKKYFLNDGSLKNIPRGAWIEGR